MRQIADAVLYEGYLLYPYRADALKNRYRWTFGTLYPRAFAEAEDGTDPWWMQVECLVRARPAASVTVTARFLRLHEPGEGVGREGEALERAVAATHRLAALSEQPHETLAAVPPEPPLHAGLAVAATAVAGDVLRLSARLENRTPLASRAPDDARRAALRHAFLSTQALLTVQGGEFVSLLDPPAALREAAAGCRNVGVWPVLVGAAEARDAMLAAPIILYDHPRVAPESPGDLFDGTEIDELLTLRVMTLTEPERQAMRSADERVRGLLERTERLTPEARIKLHGAVRDRRGVAGALRPGVRVRLRPRARGDAMDVILAGRTATVVTLEQDYDGRGYVVVTVDDDPGQDLGREGVLAHRF
ncbi:MAG: hypothetical protein ACREMB_14870, partial [Candidatus Rokuibacteriota bacterium]